MKKTLFYFFILAMASTNAAYAAKEHCAQTYKGKSFHEVVIWSGMDGFGPAQCFYGDKKVSYFYPGEQHYVVSGSWSSTMPGYQWCNLEGGGDFATCLFAKKEVL